MGIDLPNLYKLHKVIKRCVSKMFFVISAHVLLLHAILILEMPLSPMKPIIKLRSLENHLGNACNMFNYVELYQKVSQNKIK